MCTLCPLGAVRRGCPMSRPMTAVAAAAAGDAQCELSAAQVGVVQSVLQERNASCSFNMTVDAVLAM